MVTMMMRISFCRGVLGLNILYKKRAACCKKCNSFIIFAFFWCQLPDWRKACIKPLSTLQKGKFSSKSKMTFAPFEPLMLNTEIIAITLRSPPLDSRLLPGLPAERFSTLGSRPPTGRHTLNHPEKSLLYKYKSLSPGRTVFLEIHQRYNFWRKFMKTNYYTNWHIGDKRVTQKRESKFQKWCND